MKILFQNRPKHIFQAGDYYQLEQTAKALRSKGIEVEINDQPIYTPAIQYRNFDIVHTFNFSMPWTPYQVGLATMYRKPVVCSVLYHDKDNYVSWDVQRELEKQINALIFLNEGEKQRFKAKLELTEEKSHIIENGVNEMWFKKVRVKKDQRPYVLTVGRVEDLKGQLAVAKACKKIGIKYVMAGQELDKNYLKACEDEGAVHVGIVEGDDLLELYAGCTCFVLNSKSDIQPLSIMEAGAQAKPVITTKSCLYQPVGVSVVDVDNVAQLVREIKKTIGMKPNTELRDYLKTKTWEAVADQLIGIYTDLINNSEPAFVWNTLKEKNENSSAIN